MATKYANITGPVRWAKVFKPDEKYDYFGLDIQLTTEGEKLVALLGVEDKVKEDEDGNKWLPCRRYPDKTVWEDGVQKQAGPPRVTGVENGVAIGNGSVCTVRVCVYDYTFKGKPGKSLRLEKVEVNSHIPYESNQDVNAQLKNSPF